MLCLGVVEREARTYLLDGLAVLSRTLRNDLGGRISVMPPTLGRKTLLRDFMTSVSFCLCNV